jgi:predicted CXXCH cytochrome family protein
VPVSLVAALLLLVLAGSGECAGAAAAGTQPGPASKSADGGYVGSATCRSCHEAEYSAWKGSDHDLAMQEANAATVRGDFHDTTLDADGVTSTFRERDGKFFVRTEGPDGKPADYEVKFTFGVRPLQQYLVEFPGGRLQALRQAWDTRPKEDGGQRWFHLYPGQKIEHDDELHWTGIYQNWNLQCAACHSTNLRKNYDAATNTYATTYAEINVACETCHGAGANHVAWASSAKPPYAPTDDKGLAVSLGRRPEEAWHFATADARYASQSAEAAPGRAEATARMNVCASCHARRSTITEDVVPGAPLDDSSRLAVLTDPLYFADGQQRDEVYTWGSFLQSKMYAHGVVCSDCHDPHTLKKKAEGNALCTRCHNQAIFDTKSHHFHESGSKGAQCVACHMPSRTYMAIDGRRDHSLRVPRPDLSEALASPDACSSCHSGRTAKWAADAMDRWYGAGWRNRPEDGSTLRSSATRGALAAPALLALAADSSHPAIVRATAATLAEPLVRPDALAQVQALLADPDSLVRLAALGVIEPFPASTRTAAAAPLLSDPRRGVRIEAARLLANASPESFTPAQLEARAKARQEYLDSLQVDADWPTSIANLGNFQLREGKTDEAVASYQRAIKLDPHFVGAYANLADALRVQGKDKDGEEVLRRGIALVPQAAGLHHALGLLLVRKGDKTGGVEELGRAVQLDPRNGRYVYVYAIGLQSTGRLDDALAALAAADKDHPYDSDILGALVSLNLEAGRTEPVLPYARKLAEMMPGDPGIKDLIAKLERGK